MTLLLCTILWVKLFILPIVWTEADYSESYKENEMEKALELQEARKRSIIKARELGLGDLMQTIAMGEILLGSGLLPEVSAGVSFPVEDAQKFSKILRTNRKIPRNVARKHKSPHTTKFILSKQRLEKKSREEREESSNNEESAQKRSLSSYCSKRQYDPICSGIQVSSLGMGNPTNILCPSGICGESDISPPKTAHIAQGILIVPPDCPAGESLCEEPTRPPGQSPYSSVDESIPPPPPPLRPDPQAPSEETPLRTVNPDESNKCDELDENCVQLNGDKYKLVPLTHNSKPCQNSKYLISKNCAVAVKDMGEQPVWHEKIADCPTMYLEIALKTHTTPAQINTGVEHSLKGKGCLVDEKLASAIAQIANTLSYNGCCNNRSKHMISLGGKCQ